MKIIDLSHPLFETMPVYPGAEPPVINTVATVSHDGYAERRITFFSHTGTHLDAPSHVFFQGTSLDQLPIDRFAGSAAVIDFSSYPGITIEIDKLEPYSHFFQQYDFILIHTGWSRYWASDTYFTGYPVLSDSASEWIVQFNLKGLGVDTISVDPLHSAKLPVHHQLLNHQMVIVENLNRLHDLPQSGFTFWALPLPIMDGDGSPVRAIAVI